MSPGRPTRRAVIIGGGIAGLATAALLQRDGYDVTLLEAADDVGGRARSWQRDGFRFDTGPSWYLMPEVFDHFFRLLGTTAAEQFTLQRLDPGYRVFFENDPQPVDVRSGRQRSVKLFEGIETGAGRRLNRYLDSAGETYGLALEYFLYTTFASYRPLITWPIARRIGTLARLLAQPLDRYAARQFSDRRLRQILGYPAVFLGSAPGRTPSLYHLMSHLDLDDGVWYPTGGIARVVESIAGLAEREGARIHTGTRATAIETRGTGSRAVATGVRAVRSDGSERSYAADVVVSAADLHHTETALLPPRLRTYPEQWWRRRSPGPGAVLACLGIRGPVPELAHHSLFFTQDWTKNFGAIFDHPTSIPRPASLYVCRPSVTDDAVAPAGHENLFVLVPVPADPAIGSGGEKRSGEDDVEDIVDAAIEQISAWAGIPDLADRVVLRRTTGPRDFADGLNSWSGGALGPSHTLRQSAFFRGKNASAKVSGLLYAGGSTIPGIGLPMCLISAELVVKRLRGDTSTTPLAEPLQGNRVSARASTGPGNERLGFPS